MVEQHGLVGDWLSESSSSCLSSNGSSGPLSKAQSLSLSSKFIVDVSKVASLLPVTDDKRKELFLLADSAVLDIAIITQPFLEQHIGVAGSSGSDDVAALCERPAILCKICGSYLNKHCKLVCNRNIGTHMGTGSGSVFDWYCCICGSYNDSFFSAFPNSMLTPSNGDKERLEYLHHLFPETLSDDVIYQIPISIPSQANNSDSDDSMIQIFVFDEKSICDTDAVALFEETLSLVQKRLCVGTKRNHSTKYSVCILITLRNSLHIMKYNEKGISYHNIVGFDVISSAASTLSSSSNGANKNLVKNKYLFDIRFLLDNFIVISSAMHRIGIACATAKHARPSRSAFDIPLVSSSDKGSISANDVIDVAGAISKQNNNSIIHLNFIVMRNLSISASYNTYCDEKNVRSFDTGACGVAEKFAQLGRETLSRGLFIDIFHGGLANSSYDCMDSLAGATGGLLVVSEHFTDLALRNSMLKIVSDQIVEETDNIGGKYEVCSRKISSLLEVKTSINLAVSKVIGPVAVGDDCATTRIRAIDSSSIRHTLSECHSASGGSAARSLSEREADFISQIEAYNYTDSTANYYKACSVPRCSGNETFSLQLHPVYQNNARYTEGSNVYAFVQIRSRYYYKNSTGDCFLKTRSQTIKLEVTADIRKCYSCIDERVYSLVVSRGVVADFHDSSITRYGGAVDRQIDFQFDSKGSRGAETSIVDSINSFIDSLYIARHVGAIEGVRCVSIHYINNLCRAICLLAAILISKPAKMISANDSGEQVDDKTFDIKIEYILKTFYHLREGGLLDGPSSYAHESYLLRSHFLQSQRQYSSALLMPRIGLCKLQDSALGDSVVASAALDAPSDSLSLASNSICMIDLGDNIVVRGHYCGDHQAKYGQLLAAAAAEARELSASRAPAASVKILGAPYSPQERMILSRLNPLHRDNIQVIKVSMLPLLLNAFASEDEISSFAGNFPLTDQQTFFMFLSSIDFEYASKKLSRYNSSTSDRSNIAATSYVSAPMVQQISRDFIHVTGSSKPPESAEKPSSGGLASLMNSLWSRGDIEKKKNDNIDFL